MSDDQRAQAVELYRQGLSAAQVAEQMGFASKRTILNVVNAAGVTRAGTRGTVEADLKSPAMQEIARRYQSGEKIQSLAQEYGIARSTLQRRLSALKLRG
jgi:transposase-like protein